MKLSAAIENAAELLEESARPFDEACALIKEVTFLVTNLEKRNEKLETALRRARVAWVDGDPEGLTVRQIIDQAIEEPNPSFSDGRQDGK